MFSSSTARSLSSSSAAAGRWALRGAAAAAGVAALTLAGCGSDTPATSPSADTAPTTAAVPSVPVTSAPPSTVPTDAPTGGPATTAAASQDNSAVVLAAGKTAEGKLSGSTLISMEVQSTEAGGSIWEVTLVTRNGDEADVEVGSDGKKITRGPVADPQGSQDRADNRDLVAAAKLSYADAVKALPSSVEGGRITQLDLDDAGTRTVWEAEVTDTTGARHEIQIDAASGKVLKDQS